MRWSGGRRRQRGAALAAASVLAAWLSVVGAAGTGVLSGVPAGAGGPTSGSTSAGRPAVATTGLPDARVGSVYATTLAATGGTAPYTWSATGLPTGLRLTSTGLVSGTPEAAGTAEVSVTVTDHTGATGSAALALAVATRPPAVRSGYQLAAADGGVFAFGTAGFDGSTGGRPLDAPVVGMAGAPTGKGYWLVAADGGVFAFGTAGFDGSMGGRPLDAPVVGMAGAPTGKGYWLVAADGGVFAFGTAGFDGSMGGRPLDAPVVGMAGAPTGKGYWLVAADGGVFAFGTAGFDGSMGGRPLDAPVVGMAGAPTGKGYWLVAADGGVFAFGTAGFDGSMGGRPLDAPVVGMAGAPTGKGYWLVAADGGVFAFGTAGFDGSMGGRPLDAPVVGMAAGPTTPGPTFQARGSIDEAYVLGATPGEHLTVLDAAGTPVGQGSATAAGSLIVRDLAPGPGYVVEATQGGTAVTTPAFAVLGAATPPPPESFYAGQQMHAGLNYITMRDGITLAATVRLPLGKTITQGPFPTVIEDSGYAIAAPGTLIQAILHPGTPAVDTTLLPSSATAVGSVLAPLLGFATVSLQMRGTGCSGGAFDLFGLPTTYDGYDAVQTVGSQPWVLNHKVGLVGISFSGISQLFVGGARPPDLAAIAPMSTTTTLYSTGFPGGMFNSGFAGSWLDQRVADGQPAPEGGQAYAKALIRQGTLQCLANQQLRLQMQTLTALLKQGAHYTAALYDPRSPEMWAAKVDVPVFLSGALQDTQTGPQWPDMIPALAGDPTVWVTMVNGTHVDSLGPGSFTRWVEFLDLYVADEPAHLTAGLVSLSGEIYKFIAAGAPSEPLPALEDTGPTVALDRQQYAQQNHRITVLFTNGGGSDGPGAFQPLWTAGFSTWPPTRSEAATFDLAAGGALATAAPATQSTVSFEPTPTARPATDITPPGGTSFGATPHYDWTPIAGSEGLGFVSPPLASTVAAVGPASLDVYLESTATDTDLQATVSEVLPTGKKEMYVTSGFLRASDRALTPTASTATHPVPTYMAATASPLPKGRFTLVRIPIDPLGIVFAKGSRIRVTLSAPGGTRPQWSFTTFKTGGTVTDTVALGGATPSSLVLSVVPTLTPPAITPPPACGSLRGEPCRTYVAAGNGG